MISIVESAQKIRAMITKFKKQGKTILLTTHYMNEAEILCDRLAIIHEGKIVAAGTLYELRKKVGKPSASLEDVYLVLTKKKWEGDFAESNY